MWSPVGQAVGYNVNMDAIHTGNEGRPGRPPNTRDSPLPLAFLYRLLVVAASCALFLPFFGPMLDHHLAERYPYHTHLYLAGQTPEHVHFYETEAHLRLQSHQPTRSIANGPGRVGPVPDGVVYLTSYDGAGLGSVSLAAASTHVALVFPDQSDGRLLLALVSQESLPLEAFVAPPDKPPRE